MTTNEGRGGGSDGAVVSTGSGTAYSYSVEACYDDGGRARAINGIALGPNWIRLEFSESAPGVPSRHWEEFSVRHGLLSYPAAQALRWWFVANAEAEGVMGSHGLRTRLVRHEVTYSYAVAEAERTDEVGGADNVRPGGALPTAPAAPPVEASEETK